MKPTPQLLKLQQTELEILKTFDTLCSQYDLTYFITAGTLLGAVRHQGFIPWDDDIDVVMPRKDFDRLSVVCREHLPEKYFYQSRKTDANYPFFFAKIRKNGTRVTEPTLNKIAMHTGIYIDIFPLDVCPRSDRGGRTYFKWTEQLQCAVMAKVNPDFSCGYTKRYMRLIHNLLRRLPRRLLDFLWCTTRIVIRFLCGDKRLSTACASHGYPRETYEASWFSAAVPLRFHDGSFPAPFAWDRLLQNMYGDYMTPPEENNRAGHFINQNEERGKK